MKILQIYCFLQVWVLPILYLKTNGSVPPPVLSGPGVAYLGSKATFQCSAVGSTPPLTYMLMKSMRVVAKVTRSRVNRPAEFVLKVTPETEGSYHCMVNAGGNSTISNRFRLLLMRTTLTSDPDPAVLHEGARLVLSCAVSGGVQPSYTWFFNRSAVTPAAAAPWLRPAGGTLVVERVTEQHSGLYSCMTEAQQGESRSSSSREVRVFVKAFLSQPRITFSISKAADGYAGSVACWTSRGTPPASFHLSLDGQEVASVNATGSTSATFPIAMVPSQDMGVARCRVKTDVQELQSETLTLLVVPVGGRVEVEVEYLYGADSRVAAARLQCLTGRGTFPSFSWLRNDSILPVEVRARTRSPSETPRYGLADGGRSLLLTALEGSGSGSYRCRVRDSYEDSGPWLESPAVWVRTIEATLTTIETISISFCCFLLLVLVAVSVCVMTGLGDCCWANRSTATNSGSPLLPAAPPLSTQRKPSYVPSIHYDVYNQTLEIP